MLVFWGLPMAASTHPSTNFRDVGCKGPSLLDILVLVTTLYGFQAVLASIEVHLFKSKPTHKGVHRLIGPICTTPGPLDHEFDTRKAAYQLFQPSPESLEENSVCLKSVMTLRFLSVNDLVEEATPCAGEGHKEC